MTQIVEPNAAESSLLHQPRETAVYRFTGQLCGVVGRLCKYHRLDERRKLLDAPRGIRLRECFCDVLPVNGNDHALDAQEIAVYILLHYPANLGHAQTQAHRKHHRQLDRRSGCGTHHGSRCRQIVFQLFDFSRQSGVQHKIGIVHAQRGSKQSVRTDHRFGGNAARIVVDGPLNVFPRQFVDLDAHNFLQIVPADFFVSADRGRRQHAVLAFNISVYRLADGHLFGGAFFSLRRTLPP